MKKMSLASIISLIIGVTVVGIISGYYIGFRNANQKPQPPIVNVKDNPDSERIDESNFDDEDDFEAGLIKEATIGPNTILEYLNYYSECDHQIVEEIELDKHMINMTKKIFEEYIKGMHPKWEIESFSHEKIVIKIDRNHLCQNHFIIGEKDGKIAVYIVGKNGEWIIEKIFSDSPLSLLKQVDQEKIENGIITNSKEELDSILENYIS
ncbi:MAG: BofC C-terminal domain-containing protein [Tissierellales bacterium]